MRAGGQEGRRAGGQEGKRAGGQEGRRAGGQEGRTQDEKVAFRHALTYLMTLFLKNIGSW